MAGKLSLKWIDGNDVVDVYNNANPPQVIASESIHNNDVTPSFDVDNPDMWTPLSVLSGLASGYCERRAILDPVFVTAVENNAAITANWATASDTITRNFMHNIAMGSSGENNIYLAATDASFAPIGSAGASNYMVAMDSAINTLITGVNGSKYLTSTSAAFSLETLMTAAAATAAAAGSAVSTIAVDGGTMNAGTAINLPSEWAKQRKWMLDELRWTEGIYMDTNLSVLGFSPWWDLNGGYLTPAFTYQEAYNQILTLLEEHGDLYVTDTNGDGNGALALVNDMDSYRPIFTHVACKIPTALIAVDASTISSYDAYLDVPYTHDNRYTGAYYQTVTGVESCRQTSYKAEGTAQVYYVQPLTYPNIYVGAGSTITILPETAHTTLSACTLENCNFTPVTVTNIGTRHWAVTGAITGGTITDGFFYDTNGAQERGTNISYIAPNGIVVTGGTILEGNLYTDTDDAPVAGNTYDIGGCILSDIALPASLQTTIVEDTINNSRFAMFTVGILTLEDGGVAYVDKDLIRGNVLNVCTAGTLYVGTNAQQSPSFAFSNYSITITTDAAAANVPNIFKTYCINNVGYLDLTGGVDSWANRGVLVYTAGATTPPQVPAPFNTSTPCIVMVKGGSCSIYDLQSAIYNGYNQQRWVSNAIVTNGATLNLRAHDNSQAANVYVLPGGSAYAGPVLGTEDLTKVAAFSAACVVASDGIVTVSSGFSSRTNNDRYVSGMSTRISGGVITSGGSFNIEGGVTYNITESTHAWNIGSDITCVSSMTIYDGAKISTTLDGLCLDRNHITARHIQYVDPTNDSLLGCRFVYDPAYITVTRGPFIEEWYGNRYDYTYTFTHCPLYGLDDEGIIYNDAWYRYVTYLSVDGTQYYKWALPNWDSQSKVGTIYTEDGGPIKGAQIYGATFDDGDIPSEVSIDAIAGATVAEYQPGTKIGEIVNATYVESYATDPSWYNQYVNNSAQGSSFYINEQFLKGATVLIDTRIGRGAVYKEFNPFCLEGIHRGWNALNLKSTVKIVDEGEDPALVPTTNVYTGLTDKAAALAALANCNVTLGGVTVTGATDGATFNDKNQYEMVVAGLVCYAYRPPITPKDNYASFYVRQSATAAEKELAKTIYEESQNE